MTVEAVALVLLLCITPEVLDTPFGVEELHLSDYLPYCNDMSRLVQGGNCLGSELMRDLLNTSPFAACRNYVRIVAIALVALGLFGFSDIVDVDFALPASFFHFLLGLLFGWVGFLHPSGEVRLLVGGLGVLLVVTKTGVILAPLLWGESPLKGPIEVTCLVVGLLSIVAARYLREDDPINPV